MTGKVVYLSGVPSSSNIKLFDGEPDIMTITKAADLLDVAPATIRREIDRGNLEAVHVGRCVRITKTALLKYVGEVNDE